MTKTHLLFTTSKTARRRGHLLAAGVVWLSLAPAGCDCDQRSEPHVVVPASPRPGLEAPSVTEDSLPRGVDPKRAKGSTTKRAKGSPTNADAPQPSSPSTSKQAKTERTGDKPSRRADSQRDPPQRATIPSDAHVRVDLPAGLQKLLNADQRLQPWIDRIMKVAKDCYAEARADDPDLAGTIAVSITMHENARPDADLGGVSPALAGVVTCAMGQLMRIPRIPLFTGPEGAEYTIRIRFKP